jgi:hypothetical protein
MKRTDDVVSASEIASWAWCPESWRLQSLGAEPSNRAEMARGETFHVQKAAYEERSRWAASLGWWLVLFAGLVALLALLALIIIGDS